MKATARLHELGQSLWLDNITRTMLGDGTLAGLHRRALGHRPDLEPDDLRQGDLRRRRLRRADRRAQRRAEAGEGTGANADERLLRAGARRPARRRRPLRRRSTSAPTASTASSRSRSRRCSPTTPRRRSSRPRSCTPRPSATTSSSRSPAPRPACKAIEESIFAGIPINVTLLFDDRAVPGRRRGLHARDRAPDRGRARPQRRLGRLDLHQPLGRRRRRRGAGRAAQPARHRGRRPRLPRLPRAARLRPLAAADERGRPPAAAALGQHRDQGPRRLRHPLHRGLRLALHGQHDARADAARPSPTTARSAT